LHYIEGPCNILADNLSRLHRLVTPAQIAEGKSLIDPAVVSDDEDDWFEIKRQDKRTMPKSHWQQKAATDQFWRDAAEKGKEQFKKQTFDEFDDFFDFKQTLDDRNVTRDDTRGTEGQVYGNM